MRNRTRRIVAITRTAVNTPRELLAALVLFTFAWRVEALHIDIVVGQSGGKLNTSFCSAGALGCDRLPVLAQIGLDPAVLPLDGATGRQIFVTDFSDLDGGPFAVDDPGFFAGNGQLPPNLLLRYQALGAMKFFDPVTARWSGDPPGDERIRLFGGLDQQIVQDTSHCAGLLICIPNEVTTFVESSTLYTRNGIQGASSLIIDNTSATGALHAHLDWFLELPDGQRAGAVGAYLLEIALTAEGFGASDPLFVLFNRGLSNATFGQALALLTAPPPPPPPFDDGLPVVTWDPGLLAVPAGTAFDLASAQGVVSAPFRLRTTGIAGSGDVALSGNTLVVDVAGGTSQRFDGELMGAGGLVKRGSGEQQLRGASGFTGTIRVEGGTLNTLPSALGSEVVNDATLHLEVPTDDSYAGAIRGSGRLVKTGAGRLTLSGVNSYTGGSRLSGPVRISQDVNLGAPLAALTLDHATLETSASIAMSRPISARGENTFDTQHHRLALLGPVAGDGLLFKRGIGELSLQGLQPFTGRLHVSEGLLALRGALAGSVEVATGAALSGSADIGQDLVLRAGSRLRVDVTPDGEIDQLRSVNGRITIEGARLELRATAGDYPIQRVHPLLSSAQGIFGTFATVDSNLAFLTPSLSYEHTQVLLRLARNDLSFADLAETPNQRAAGRLLDTVSRYSQGDMANVIGALESVDTAEVAAAFDALVGTPLVGIPGVATIQANGTMRQIAARLSSITPGGFPTALSLDVERDILFAMRDAQDTRADALYAAASDAASHLPAHADHGVWMRAMAGLGEYDVTGQQEAEADHTGVVVGYDWRLSAATTLGLYGTYTDGELNQALPISSTALNGWQAGAYGRWRRGALHVDGLASYGHDNYETSRQLALGPLLRHALAEFGGESYNAYVETGYTFDPGVRVQPFVGLQWARQTRDAYQERGADALNLQVEREETGSLRTLLGLRIRHAVGRISTGAVLAELRGAWAHEFEPGAEFRARLSGDQNGTLFTVRNTNATSDAGNLGAGIVANLTEHAQIFADFDGEFSTAHRAFSVSAGVRARW